MSDQKSGGVKSLAAAKQKRDRERYNAMVLDAFDGLEHAAKREVLDRKAETQIKARERL